MLELYFYSIHTEVREQGWDLVYKSSHPRLLRLKQKNEGSDANLKTNQLAKDRTENNKKQSLNLVHLPT